MRLRLLLLCAAALPAAAETLDPVNDLRVGVSAVSTPKIEETVSNAAGQTDYSWRGMDTVAPRIDVAYVHGPTRNGHASAGLIWAIGLGFSDIDTTPTRYVVNGGAGTGNARPDLAVHYRQYGALLGLGYGTRPLDTALGDFHVELLPLVRGGWSTAETVSPGVNPQVEKGSAAWWEAGGQVSLVLCSERWVAALRGAWLYGRNSVTIDLPSSGSSKLTLTRNGPEGGLDVGYRF